MKPLATSVFCPNDCDRKHRDDFKDEEATPKLFGLIPKGFSQTQSNPVIDPSISDAIDEWYDTIMGPSTTDCKSCFSDKTGPFPGGPAGTSMHCWDCGDVW